MTNKHTKPQFAPGSTLTARERETVAAACDGITIKQIGERLGLTPSTTRTYLKRIYSRLGLHSRVALMGYAQANPEILGPVAPAKWPGESTEARAKRLTARAALEQITELSASARVLKLQRDERAQDLQALREVCWRLVRAFGNEPAHIVDHVDELRRTLLSEVQGPTVAELREIVAGLVMVTESATTDHVECNDV